MTEMRSVFDARINELVRLVTEMSESLVDYVAEELDELLATIRLQIGRRLLAEKLLAERTTP